MGSKQHLVVVVSGITVVSGVAVVSGVIVMSGVAVVSGVIVVSGVAVVSGVIVVSGVAVISSVTEEKSSIVSPELASLACPNGPNGSAYLTRTHWAGLICSASWVPAHSLRIISSASWVPTHWIGFMGLD